MVESLMAKGRRDERQRGWRKGHDGVKRRDGVMVGEEWSENQGRRGGDGRIWQSGVERLTYIRYVLNFLDEKRAYGIRCHLSDPPALKTLLKIGYGRVDP